MKIIDLLEKGHTKALRDQIIRYVGNDPRRFSELVRLFLTSHHRIAQRAAWPLGYCAQKHPKLVKPHLRKLAIHLDKPGLHQGITRNIVRLLQFVDIPKSLHGRVAESCFRFLSDTKQPIAVRVFSMTVLNHLAENYPELKKELLIIIEGQLPYASAAFRSRANRIIRKSTSARNLD